MSYWLVVDFILRVTSIFDWVLFDVSNKRQAGNSGRKSVRISQLIWLCFAGTSGWNSTCLNEWEWPFIYKTFYEDNLIIWAVIAYLLRSDFKSTFWDRLCSGRLFQFDFLKSISEKSISEKVDLDKIDL